MSGHFTSPSSLIPAQNLASEIDSEPLRLDLESFSGEIITKTDAILNGKKSVYKFGGTSVGSPERLGQLLSIISKEQHRVVAVVVSAMGKTTDFLLEAAALASNGDIEASLKLIDFVEEIAIKNGTETKLDGKKIQLDGIEKQVIVFFKPLRDLLLGMSLLREKTAAAMDAVLSFGERISAQIVAALLSASGVLSVYVDARKWVCTDHTFGSAHVFFDESKEKILNLSKQWKEENLLPVVTGFIGESVDGRITTLGRNGSDYTATLLSACLQTDFVVINTDISGVMTADPRIVDGAVSVSHLSHQEALELAIYGTRMFHARTMIPLIQAQVSMLIRNTMDPSGHGTLISGQNCSSSASVTCTTSLENLCLIEVRTRILQEADAKDFGHIGRRVLQCLESSHIHIWLSIRAAHGQAITVVIPADMEENGKSLILKELQLEVENNELDEIYCTGPVTMISIVGEQLKETFNNEARFFTSLAKAGIDVLAIGQGSSSRSLSCIIHGSDTKLAVRRVHDAFNANLLESNVVLLGCSTTSIGLLQHFLEQTKLYEKEHRIIIRLVGFGSNCLPFQFNKNGIDVEVLIEKLSGCTSVLKFENEFGSYKSAMPEAMHLDFLEQSSAPILVDCSGRSDNESLYLDCFERLIHVVVSNARSVLSLAKTKGTDLDSFLLRKKSFFLYDSAIGASLPILDTLSSILRTGDRLLKLEASLSGSVGFITDLLMKGKHTEGRKYKLSEAVQLAFEKGYMESDPKQDLLGIDVANKLLVLARALSIPLQRESIQITPLIPNSVIETADCQESFEQVIKAISEYDEAFTKKYVQPAFDKDLQLRFVASINVGASRLEALVQPLLVNESHPAYRACGKDIVVGFTTTQYQHSPLVISGSGTGGMASSSGVVRDILKILHSLQG